MRIVRAPRADHFLTVPNATVRDVRLSRRARGLLVELLSYRDGWQTSSDELTRTGPEGRDAIRAALAELEAAGYLLRARVRDEDGRWATISAVHDTPQDAGTLPPGVTEEDVVARPRVPKPRRSRAFHRDGKSVPVLTSDDASNPQVSPGTDQPASARPASARQALSKKTTQEDPPPPSALADEAGPADAVGCPRHPQPYTAGRGCRGCGTTTRQLAGAAQREAAQRLAAAQRASDAARRALTAARDAAKSVGAPPTVRELARAATRSSAQRHGERP